MKNFAEQIFYGLAVELLSLIITYISKERKALAISIFTIGTVFAGVIAFVPSVTIEWPPIFQAKYDDFNNSAFDGKYNTNLWEYDGTKHVELKQENGVLILKTTSNDEDGGNILVADSESWTFEELNSMEAKLKIDSSQRGKGSFVKIQASTTTAEKITYWIECQLDNRETSHTSYYCNYTASEWPSDNWSYEYQTEVIETQYDTWYVSRFEINPKTLEIQFFLDGKLIGSYIPKNTDIIRKKRFYPLIGSWTGADEDFLGYIDDVYIKP